MRLQRLLRMKLPRPKKQKNNYLAKTNKIKKLNFKIR
jgi:hypothetical protein